MAMRIGLALDVFRSYVSGVTRHVSLLKSSLEQRGHDVYVFTFDRPSAPAADPKVISSPAIFSSLDYSWGIGYTQKARLALRQMDLVHVHHPFVTGPLVHRYTGGRIPVVFTNHTRYDLYLKAYWPWLPSSVGNLFLFRLLRAYTRTVDRLIAPSPGMQTVMRSWRLPGQIDVIPNGIYLEPFLHPNRNLTREDLGLSPNDFVWVYVGRVSPEKSLPFLLDAFCLSLARDPKMSLLIVGDGPLLPELIEKVTTLGLTNQVKFTGLVEYERLPDYLSVANAFVTASQTEVHPLTLIEAIASQLPVVGIRSPGVADIIINGQNGILSEPDMGDFAEAMLSMSLQTTQYQALRIAASASAGQYSIDYTAERLENLYNQLIGKNK